MTTPAEEKKAKMLERVRALLAKADGTNFPAEADTFRQKADELMTEYAIEQWEVNEAQGAVGARPKPERRDFDVSWYGTNSRHKELWALMCRVAEHCRCKLIYWHSNAGIIPAIGLPSDLDWFDLLFTHLMLQMGKGLEPHPNPERSMIENLVTMKEAGMKWERIGELLYNADQLDHEYDRNMGVDFTKKYTAYCREHGRERLRTTPSVYQRSFAVGFVNEVSTRLRRQASERGTGMELVLRDIKDEIDGTAEEMFGKDPERYAVQKSGVTDPHAELAGIEAGRAAKLHANPNETVQQSSRVRGALES
jgi:hypothetical protein